MHFKGQQASQWGPGLADINHKVSSVSVCLSVCMSPSMSVCVCFSLFPFLWLALCLSFSSFPPSSFAPLSLSHFVSARLAVFFFFPVSPSSVCLFVFDGEGCTCTQSTPSFPPSSISLPSVCLSLSLCLSLCMSVFPFVCPSVYLSSSRSLSVCMSLSMSACVCFPLFPCLFMACSLSFQSFHLSSFSRSLCLPLYLYVFPTGPPSNSVSLYLSVCMSVSLFLSLSPPPPLSLSPSSLSLCLPLSLSISFPRRRSRRVNPHHTSPNLINVPWDERSFDLQAVFPLLMSYTFISWAPEGVGWRGVGVGSELYRLILPPCCSWLR